MIQHHLVFHFTSLEDGNTYYEANPHAAYYLVRSGKILKLVEDRLGEYAARVMEALLFLGHASVRQLEDLPELKYRKSAAVLNGTGHDDAELQGDEIESDPPAAETNGEDPWEHKLAPLHPTLKALASHGYIMRVREAHFQSPSDNWLEAQRIVSARSDMKGLKGKKQEEAITLKTQELVEERINGDLTQGLIHNGLPRGLKRKFGNVTSNEQSKVSRNGINRDHVRQDDDGEEENEWSEDEDGFDNIPMEVSGQSDPLRCTRTYVRDRLAGLLQSTMRNWMWLCEMLDLSALRNKMRLQ